MRLNFDLIEHPEKLPLYDENILCLKVGEKGRQVANYHDQQWGQVGPR